MKVAVVQNRNSSGVINNFGQKCPEVYGEKAIRNVVTALCGDGRDVLLCEGDKNLLSVLTAFMPPDPNGKPTGLVFNMAYGIQGECRYTHVPAMLEIQSVGPRPRPRQGDYQAASASRWRSYSQFPGSAQSFGWRRRSQVPFSRETATRVH